MFEVAQIQDNLWQGSKPPEGLSLKHLKFDSVILCAEEYQPSSLNEPPFPGVQVIHAPNDDDFDNYPSRKQVQTAIWAAQEATQQLLLGKKVLSTCWMGWNRSGLVTALTLHFWKGVSGYHAIQLIKEKRGENALSNPQFQSLLRKLK